MDFQDYFQKQPESIKEFVSSEKNTLLIGSISGQFNLNSEQSQNLASETGRVIVGMTQRNEYVPHLVDRLGVEQGVAEQIASEVTSKIFNKLDSLQSGVSRDMSAVDKVLAGSQWGGKVQEIAERYLIKDSQTLEEIVEKAARANNHDISDTIARSLGITNEKSAKIADALRQKVLIPIQQYVSKQAEPEPVAPEIAPTPSNEQEEEYETKPEEHSERLNRLQILKDIENPLGKKESQETGKPAAPTAEESAQLARIIPQKPKEEVVEKPTQAPPVVPPKPTPAPEPRPEPKPEPQKPTPAPTPLPTKPEQKSRPSDEGNLLSTIQQAQQKHGNIVDQKMNTPQTSKAPEKPEAPTAPQNSANGYGSSDPYREPIE